MSVAMVSVLRKTGIWGEPSATPASHAQRQRSRTALRPQGLTYSAVYITTTTTESLPLMVPSGEMTQLRLTPIDSGPSVREVDGNICVTLRGWYEVLLSVQWDRASTAGTRFAHTTTPDSHPLHSEAISADVLARISDGRQLLRGNTVFGPDGIDRIGLEVWHDAGTDIAILDGSLDLRRLS